MEFPNIHNEGKASIVGGTIAFTYLDSTLNAITVAKPLLTAIEIMAKTKERLARFKSAPPGARESDFSRTERKYISAHPKGILANAWQMMDHHTKMEFVMMLDKRSHHGISDPAWAQRHAAEVPDVIGDDRKVL